MNAEINFDDLAAVLSRRTQHRAEIYAWLITLSAKEKLELFQQVDPDLPPLEQEKSFSHFLESLRFYLDTQRKISPQQNAILYSYFQTGYIRINPILRAGGEEALCLQPLIHAMKNAMSVAEPVHETVWRGLALPNDALARYQAGAEIVWPAFSSTSRDRSVAVSFGSSHGDSEKGILFEIHAKKCLDAHGLSDKIWEDEVLCLPGTRVNVVARKDPDTIVLEEVE